MPILFPSLLPVVPLAAQTTTRPTEQPVASEAASVPFLGAHSRHLPVPDLSLPVPSALPDTTPLADLTLTSRLSDVRLFKGGSRVVLKPILVSGPKK